MVGYHPFFITKAGMPTHFNGPSGAPIAVATHVHLLSDHVRAALSAGWVLRHMIEPTIDDRRIAVMPGWSEYRDVPISFLFVWARPRVRESASEQRRLRRGVGVRPLRPRLVAQPTEVLGQREQRADFRPLEWREVHRIPSLATRP